MLVAAGGGSPPPPPPPPPPPVGANTADRHFWWTDPLSPADGNPGTLDLMSAGDYAYFAAKGMKGIVTKFPYTGFVGMGSDQTFPPNPADVHPTSTAHRDARKLVNVVMPALASAGLGAIAVVDLKNRVLSTTAAGGVILGKLFPPGGGTWNNDTSPSTCSKLSDWATFCRLVGFDGLMFDGENYTANDGSHGDIWGGQEFVTQWKARGYEVGAALAAAWPDVKLHTYFNFLPGSVDEIKRGENFEPTAAPSGYSQVNFWSGVTKAMHDVAPSGSWCVQFHEARHFRGPQPTGYRQQDICGTAAWFSRNWAHWWAIADRIGVQPFIWLNDGPGVIAEDISYNPGQLAADAANLRNWHVVTVGDPRVLQHFVYDAELTMPTPALDCSPYSFPADYESTLVTMSTAAILSNNPPALNISSPATGSTGASSITVVSGDTTDDFGVVSVTWENTAWSAGHVNRKGHVAMTFNKLSGTLESSFTWRHDLSLSGVAGPIPLAMGANPITFTARDSKGATTSVTRTITRV